MSDVIGFVRNSDEECSSNIDSDEEGEIKGAKAQTDCNSGDNKRLAHHIPRRFLATT